MRDIGLLRGIGIRGAGFWCVAVAGALAGCIPEDGSAQQAAEVAAAGPTAEADATQEPSAADVEGATSGTATSTPGDIVSLGDDTSPSPDTAPSSDAAPPDGSVTDGGPLHHPDGSVTDGGPLHNPDGSVTDGGPLHDPDGTVTDGGPLHDPDGTVTDGGPLHDPDGTVSTGGTCPTGDGLNDACSCDEDAHNFCAGLYGQDWQTWATSHGYTTASWKYALLDCLADQPVSEACTASLARRAALNEAMMDACQTYCTGLPPQPGAEPCVDHLKSIYDTLTEACRDALDAHEAAKKVTAVP